MIDPALEGKTAIVTGINNPRGIGAAVAAALAAEGVAVFATYLRAVVAPKMLEEAAKGAPGEALYRHLSSGSASEVVERIRNAGGRIEAVEADLDDASLPREIFDRAELPLIMHCARGADRTGLASGIAPCGTDAKG